MLETRNLVKIYKPKKGVPVTALNNVSLRFPEKGMVFLLGKSGSGKSTLLNVLGGLDRYNSGEILIKGQSSRTFRQQHFDSYRNTYVGFIFQEYNILDEFSVGTNIALALQLQGKKPTTEQINDILRQVDLEGYGNRNPNELSGGQKQRVAIARALVKSPEIIMADEPTGALDSATGRQILTTLKKLSKDKLVIVVSHDREFAEQYGDRIVELADGQVIRDVERQSEELPDDFGGPAYEEDTISVPQGYRFTEEDSRAITAYIQNLLDEGREPKIQSVSGERHSFVPTDPAKIPVSQGGYHLIKSRLPLKHAFKLGASGLKHKKFRLVMTILLSCIAFTLFGFADTIASYDYVDTSVSSLSDPASQVGYAAFEMSLREEWEGINGKPEYYYNYATMTKEHLEIIEEKTGIHPYPVYTFGSGYSSELGFAQNILEDSDQEYGYSICRDHFAGLVESSEELLEDLNAELVAGSLPAPGTNQIAVSTFILQSFQGDYRYCDAMDGEPVEIKTAQDLVGKTLQVGQVTFEVSGVFETGIDYSRYEVLEEESDREASFSEELLKMALEQELRYALNYSLSGLGVVSRGQIDTMHELLATAGYEIYGEMNLMVEGQSCAGLSEIDSSKVVWLDGKERKALADDEIIVSEFAYQTVLAQADYLENRETLDFTAISGKKNPNYAPIMDMWFYLEASHYGNWQSIGEVKIVGIIRQSDTATLEDYQKDPEAFGPTHVFSDAVMERVDLRRMPAPIAQTISPMPTERGDIRTAVELTELELSTDSGDVVQFSLCNPVSFELATLDEAFDILSGVFVWTGVVFVVFASLLFSNFIATSVAYKKREIGILRAIGSRSNDVFRIFFAESFIIAMINFVLSLAGTVAIAAVVNYFVRNAAGLLLTVLNVGIRQVGLLFGICLAGGAIPCSLRGRPTAATGPSVAIGQRKIKLARGSLLMK